MPKHPPPPPPIPIPGKSSNGVGRNDAPDGQDSGDDAQSQTPPSFPGFSPSDSGAMSAYLAHGAPNPQRRPSLPVLSLPESLPSAPQSRNRHSVFIPTRTGSATAGLNGGGEPYLKTSNPREDLVQKAFGPLEDYLVTAFTSCDCLNASFVKRRSGGEHFEAKNPDNKPQVSKIPPQASRTPWGANEGRSKNVDIPVTNRIGEKEAILLQRGRFIGKEMNPVCREKEKHRVAPETKPSVRSPGIDWESVDEFYDMVINIGATLASRGNIAPEHSDEEAGSKGLDTETAADIEGARAHIAWVLLKATENLLKRPGRPLKKPEDVRFLLIILANPLLYPESARPASRSVHGMSSFKLNVPGRGMEGHTNSITTLKRQASTSSNRSGGSGNGPGHHSGIIKRIMGLLSNLPNECHHYLVSWFTRMPEVQFRRLVELVGSFVTYRLTRQAARKRPQGGSGMLGQRTKQLPYNDDWQIKAAARVMSLFFSANNNTAGRRGMILGRNDEETINSGVIARREARRRGQIILTSEFYNMLLDYHDLIADFDAWESRSSKFCFCQYPFLLSMGSKIQILEHDAKRQMEVQARQAFFNSISTRRAVNQYLMLKVRRECLVEDSLRGISEGVGGIDDIKKGLRIEFIGEDGVDAGGLKKEWFLLVARDVFDPNYGELYCPSQCNILPESGAQSG